MPEMDEVRPQVLPIPLAPIEQETLTEAAHADRAMDQFGLMPLAPREKPTWSDVKELADLIEANPHRSLVLAAQRRGYGGALLAELERRHEQRETFNKVIGGLDSEMLGSAAQSAILANPYRTPESKSDDGADDDGEGLGDE